MSDELIDMDLRSSVSTISLKEKKELPKPKKQVTHSKTFEDAYQLAATDSVPCVKLLVRLAKRKIEGLVKFAGIQENQHRGMKGSRRHLRVLEMQLFASVLEINKIRTTHSRTLCEGRNADTTSVFRQRTPRNTVFGAGADMHVLCEAGYTGQFRGCFRRGRWLVAMAPVHEGDAKVREGWGMQTRVRAQAMRLHTHSKHKCMSFLDRYGLKGRKRKSKDYKIVLKQNMKAAKVREGAITLQNLAVCHMILMKR